jgi:hypothetical protein
LGDETSYPPNQDNQSIQEPETIQELLTSQEPVTQEQSGDFPSHSDSESQSLNDAGLGRLEETSSEAHSPDGGGAAVDFAEPAEPDSLQLDPEPVPAVEIRSAEPAPLVASGSGDAPTDSSRELLGLPLQFLNQLLQRLGSAKLDTLADLIPAARLVAIALLAGVALKLTGATLGAINDIPVLGGLLELIGLVTLLNFLSRNALKHQKRAELLSRIRKLKQDFLG